MQLAFEELIATGYANALQFIEKQQIVYLNAKWQRITSKHNGVKSCIEKEFKRIAKLKSKLRFKRYKKKKKDII